MKNTANFLSHLFIPRESNNHRAKILHLQSLFLVVCLLVFSSFLIPQINKTNPQVLGVSTNISVSDLVTQTNEQRNKYGLPSLKLDSQLTEAAQKKADNMFAKDYWAHNGPDGTTPWDFITNAGYQYVYAGENLARGFSTTIDVMNAWMASPDHRENILSKNFVDVGFAVESGKLTGEDTTLVVEEFGNKGIAPAQETGQASPAAAVSAQSVELSPQPNQAVLEKPTIDRVSFTKNLALIIVGIFIIVLSLDMIVIQRKKVVRFVGHNLDHIFFLIIILSLIAILTKQAII